MFQLQDAQTINHLVVFITEPFPQGYAATVHFNASNDQWNYLGFVSNDKPSAIFRVSSIDSPTCQLGISIEPIASIPPPPPRKIETQVWKILESRQINSDFYNYTASFATNLPKDAMVLFNAPDNMYLPFKVIFY